MPQLIEPKFAVRAKSSQPTLVKEYPGRNGGFGESFKLGRDDDLLLVTRMDFKKETGHYEIELAVPKNGLFTWHVFSEHVERADLPEFFLQAIDATVIKRRIRDAADLSPEEKFNFDPSTQPLQANWIQPASENSKYLEFSLKRPVKGVHNWFAFAEHVKPSKVRTMESAR